ncbi:DUF1972 domain-containing protein [Sphingobium sp. H39-3-25]|uniref:DUF1972 domain-containing protein n=1 Tax=Sphingobium arseniciresistens TaxID=3030834 RepID=UPI0023B9D6DD|nr:DUF1972 domain-containing protein [Sphingobium arseniciresistens]
MHSVAEQQKVNWRQSEVISVPDQRKLIILGIRGIPAAHGGFETFAERLALWMRDAGWEVTVYCQGSDSGKREESVWEGIRRIHIPVKLDNAPGTIEFDYKATKDALKQPGIVLTLGYNTGFLSTWLRMKGRTNYINMDGLEWKRAKYAFGPKAFLWVNERLAAMSGTKLIADHPAIADHLATRTKRDRITVIPYGAHDITQADHSALEPLGLADTSFFTVIARPEPENSVLEIVRAFSEKPRGCKLAVLGRYSESHAYQAEVLAAAGPEVVFTGPVYDSRSVSALRFYSLAYIHGHQVGGTNPSLVEALGAGNAVIAHENPFNRWVAGEAGLYFFDQKSCEQHISHIIEDEMLRKKLSAAARARWADGLTWPDILTSYQKLLEGA